MLRVFLTSISLLLFAGANSVAGSNQDLRKFLVSEAVSSANLEYFDSHPERTAKLLHELFTELARDADRGARLPTRQERQDAWLRLNKKMCGGVARISAQHPGVRTAWHSILIRAKLEFYKDKDTNLLPLKIVAASLREVADAFEDLARIFERAKRRLIDSRGYRTERELPRRSILGGSDLYLVRGNEDSERVILEKDFKGTRSIRVTVPPHLWSQIDREGSPERVLASLVTHLPYGHWIQFPTLMGRGIFYFYPRGSAPILLGKKRSPMVVWESPWEREALPVATYGAGCGKVEVTWQDIEKASESWWDDRLKCGEILISLGNS